MQTKSPFNRIVLIVLDGAGIGAMPDAPEWGDAGSDTLGHILESRAVHLPQLQSIGLGNIRPLQGVPPSRKQTAGAMNSSPGSSERSARRSATPSKQPFRCSTRSPT